MQVNTYLAFSGDCKAAFQLYERVVGGKITFMMTHGESPMAEQTAPEWRDKIMHATLKTPGGILQGADHPQGRTVKPAGFCVSVSVKETAEAERIFNALAEGGQVQMALQKTFWSPAFGMLIDQFGIPWMINCEEAA